jgi:hypothetical protein
MDLSHIYKIENVKTVVKQIEDEDDDIPAVFSSSSS